MKLKVKSEFSLSMGLMLINHSNPYIRSTTVLYDIIIIVGQSGYWATHNARMQSQSSSKVPINEVNAQLANVAGEVVIACAGDFVRPMLLV